MDQIANIAAQFFKSALIFSGNRYSKYIIDGVINSFNRSGIKLTEKKVFFGANLIFPVKMYVE